MSLHFAYGRSILNDVDWSITVNVGGGNLTGATKYFSLQAQNPVGKNLQLISTAKTFSTGDSITFTINETALTNAEGWTHYVIGVSNNATASTFNQILRIPIYDMSTGAVDFDTPNVFPLSVTISEDAQLTTGEFVADKLSLPTTNIVYGMRRGVTENNYIYEYNPFSTATANNDDIIAADTGNWLKKEEFTTYVENIDDFGGCAFDILNLSDFSNVELPTYNADGTNSFRVKYYVLNNSGFTLQPGTGVALAAQIGGVERTELFDGKIYYNILGIVTPSDATLRTTSSISGQTLDFINTDYVYSKTNPVTITKDYIQPNTGLYVDVYVNFLNLEFNNLLPDGYLQIYLSFISPKGVFTPVGTLFEKGIIYNKYNKRRVLPDVGLNVVVGEGEGIVKNFTWYSCNTTVSGLTANTTNQKLYVNINGVVFPDVAERTSSVLRAIVDTTPKESKISTWTSYSAVTANSALTVTVDYECDSELNQKIRETYPDVIAGDWGIFNVSRITIYVQRESDGEIRKFENFIPAGNNVSQEFIITDWSAGTIVGSTPNTSSSFFDPSTNSFSTTAGVGNFAADNYRVAHTYVWNGDTVSDISHSVAEGCIAESQINGEQVFGTTTYNTIAQIKAETDIYDGYELYCKATERLYVYDESSSETADDYDVLQPVGGIGRWVSTAKDTMRSFAYETSPTVNNDSSEGYRVTDKWLDVVEEKEYTLIDNTAGAAVWKQVGGGGTDVIELSADVTWYVAPDGDADADGLTVGAPITLEEAASRVFRVVPTDTNFKITIEIADGSYTYANNYVFKHPDVEFDFSIKLHGQDWVGINDYPTVNISTRQITLINFDRYCNIENIHYEGLTVDNSSTEIFNVACAYGCYIKEYNGFAYVHGVYKFSNSGTYAFYISNGYLDLDVTTFDSGGTTRNYTEGFIKVGYGGALYLYNNVITTGIFTGKRIYFNNDSAILDGGEEYLSSLPGDQPIVYPNYLFSPSNTLATTASLSTVATSGSYNDLSNLPTLGTAAALDVGTVNGVCPLDSGGKVDASYLPSYVDDVLEYADLASLPVTGETGKIYITLDTSKAYRWTGSVYVEITSDPLPDQTGHNGKFLTTNGTVTSWSLVNAASVSVDTTNFNVNLSGTDTTVQAALETLDDLVAGGGTGLNWLGTWDNATNYVADDAVEYQGSSYIANASNLNKIPGTDPEWDVLALKGDTGATGTVSSASGITLTHTTTPADPGAGNTTIYAKSDGKLYFLPTGGSETEVGAGTGTTTVATKTTTYTANDGERIPCDTITTGAFTITTPASGRFQVVDIIGTSPTTGFGANNLTIIPASGTIMGSATLVLDIGAISPEFELIGTDWRIVNRG